MKAQINIEVKILKQKSDGDYLYGAKAYFLGNAIASVDMSYRDEEEAVECLGMELEDMGVKV